MSDAPGAALAAPSPMSGWRENVIVGVREIVPPSAGAAAFQRSDHGDGPSTLVPMIRAGFRVIRVLAITVGLAACGTDMGLPEPGPIPVIPGAAGFGMTTPAGRGGKIIAVTSLEDNGPGSLRAALSEPGPRIIVFEVGGTIELDSMLYLRNPFATVAGQTAPDPGITLAGGGLVVLGHDVLVQHIRARVGDRPGGADPEIRDGFAVAGYAHNVVIDHCSVSWALDEGMDASGHGVRDITFRNCIIAENLYRSLYPGSPMAKGMLIDNWTVRISVVGSVFAHNDDRNPVVKGASSIALVNNLVYDVGSAAIGFWDPDDAGPIDASVVGNVVVPGPSTRGTGLLPIILGGSIKPMSRFYVFDNQAPGVTADPWSIVSVYPNPLPVNPRTSTAPVWPEGLVAAPSHTVEVSVLLRAGARPRNRDAVDLRIVDQIRGRRGRIIDSQDEVGGWPAASATRRTLQLPRRPHDDDDRDGYTNIEEWLHALAAEVERPSHLVRYN